MSLCIFEAKMLTMKNIIILVVVVLFIACNTQTNDTIKLVDVINFKKEISNNDIQLIDVRTPKEYNQGHIKGALLIDFFSEEFKTNLKKLDKKSPIYVYCKSGGRSGKTSEILADMGFTKIVDLKGGFTSWKNTQ